MAKEEEQKDEVKEEKQEKALGKKEEQAAGWVPKTELGKRVLAGEITSLEQVFEAKQPVLEPEIVDYLSQLEEKMIEFKKTTRVVRAGRKFSFRVAVLVGNRNGLVGLGTAKDTEKWPAVEKATRKAKLNLVRVRRGCGSWECPCGTGHSVPFKVTGKNASVRVTFLPAPKGTGLVAGDAIKDVLEFAGVKDVWANVKGATDTRLNFVRAAIDALEKTTKMKASDVIERKAGKGGNA
jgi:small subunit ribosomal protein S5